jgi:hypothetical protein
MNFQKSTLAACAVLALAAVSTQANAFSYSITNTATSFEAGASTIDFGVSPVNNTLPVVGSAAVGDVVYAGTAGGVGFTYTDGALYNPTISPISAITARPVGSTDNFWSIGTHPAAQTGPGVATFTGPLTYYGFLWGSLDQFNTVQFYSGATMVGSFTPPPPAVGDQLTSKYFNAYAGAGQAFTSVKFLSSGNAFETDNHAVIAVPEPETYAMLLAGLGLIGTIARRRNKSKSV